MPTSQSLRSRRHQTIAALGQSYKSLGSSSRSSTCDPISSSAILTELTRRSFQLPPSSRCTDISPSLSMRNTLLSDFHHSHDRQQLPNTTPSSLEFDAESEPDFDHNVDQSLPSSNKNFISNLRNKSRTRRPTLIQEPLRKRSHSLSIFSHNLSPLHNLPTSPSAISSIPSRPLTSLTHEMHTNSTNLAVKRSHSTKPIANPAHHISDKENLPLNNGPSPSSLNISLSTALLAPLLRSQNTRPTPSLSIASTSNSTYPPSSNTATTTTSNSTTLTTSISSASSCSHRSPLSNLHPRCRSQSPCPPAVSTASKSSPWSTSRSRSISPSPRIQPVIPSQPRKSRFREASMHDRPSENPPSLFTRYTGPLKVFSTNQNSTSDCRSNDVSINTSNPPNSTSIPPSSASNSLNHSGHAFASTVDHLMDEYLDQFNNDTDDLEVKHHHTSSSRPLSARIRKHPPTSNSHTSQHDLTPVQSSTSRKEGKFPYKLTRKLNSSEDTSQLNQCHQSLNTVTTASAYRESAHNIPSTSAGPGGRTTAATVTFSTPLTTSTSYESHKHHGSSRFSKTLANLRPTNIWQKVTTTWRESKSDDKHGSGHSSSTESNANSALHPEPILRSSTKSTLHGRNTSKSSLVSASSSAKYRDDHEAKLKKAYNQHVPDALRKTFQQRQESAEAAYAELKRTGRLNGLGVHRPVTKTSKVDQPSTRCPTTTHTNDVAQIYSSTTAPSNILSAFNPSPPPSPRSSMDKISRSNHTTTTPSFSTKPIIESLIPLTIPEHREYEDSPRRSSVHDTECDRQLSANSSPGFVTARTTFLSVRKSNSDLSEQYTAVKLNRSTASSRNSCPASLTAETLARYMRDISATFDTSSDTSNTLPRKDRSLIGSLANSNSTFAVPSSDQNGSQSSLSSFVDLNTVTSSSTGSTTCDSNTSDQLEVSQGHTSLPPTATSSPSESNPTPRCNSKLNRELIRQARLCKRVSNLESKLEEARRELNQSLANVLPASQTSTCPKHHNYYFPKPAPSGDSTHSHESTGGNVQSYADLCSIHELSTPERIDGTEAKTGQSERSTHQTVTAIRQRIPSNNNSSCGHTTNPRAHQNPDESKGQITGSGSFYSTGTGKLETAKKRVRRHTTATTSTSRHQIRDCLNLALDDDCVTRPGPSRCVQITTPRSAAIIASLPSARVSLREQKDLGHATTKELRRLSMNHPRHNLDALSISNYEEIIDDKSSRCSDNENGYTVNRCTFYDSKPRSDSKVNASLVPSKTLGHTEPSESPCRGVSNGLEPQVGCTCRVSRAVTIHHNGVYSNGKTAGVYETDVKLRNDNDENVDEPDGQAITASKLEYPEVNMEAINTGSGISNRGLTRTCINDSNDRKYARNYRKHCSAYHEDCMCDGIDRPKDENCVKPSDCFTQAECTSCSQCRGSGVPTAKASHQFSSKFRMSGIFGEQNTCQCRQHKKRYFTSKRRRDIPEKQPTYYNGTNGPVKSCRDGVTDMSCPRRQAHNTVLPTLKAVNGASVPIPAEREGLTHDELSKSKGCGSVTSINNSHIGRKIDVNEGKSSPCRRDRVTTFNTKSGPPSNSCLIPQRDSSLANAVSANSPQACHYRAASFDDAVRHQGREYASLSMIGRSLHNAYTIENTSPPTQLVTAAGVMASARRRILSTSRRCARRQNQSMSAIHLPLGTIGSASSQCEFMGDPTYSNDRDIMERRRSLYSVRSRLNSMASGGEGSIIDDGRTNEQNDVDDEENIYAESWLTGVNETRMNDACVTQPDEDIAVDYSFFNDMDEEDDDKRNCLQKRGCMRDQINVYDNGEMISVGASPITVNTGAEGSVCLCSCHCKSNPKTRRTTANEVSSIHDTTPLYHHHHHHGVNWRKAWSRDAYDVRERRDDTKRVQSRTNVVMKHLRRRSTYDVENLDRVGISGVAVPCMSKGGSMTGGTMGKNVSFVDVLPSLHNRVYVCAESDDQCANASLATEHPTTTSTVCTMDTGDQDDVKSGPLNRSCERTKEEWTWPDDIF